MVEVQSRSQASSETIKHRQSWPEMRTAITAKELNFWEVTFYSWVRDWAWLWKSREYGHSKRRAILSKPDSITSQKAWIFSDTVVRTAQFCTKPQHSCLWHEKVFLDIELFKYIESFKCLSKQHFVSRPNVRWLFALCRLYTSGVWAAVIVVKCAQIKCIYFKII